MEFEEDDDQSENSENSENDDDTEMNEKEEAALRKALDAVISKGKGDGDDDDDESISSESSMDDEQMMAIDDQLTEVFKTEAERRGKGKGLCNDLMSKGFRFLISFLQVLMHSAKQHISRIASWT